MMNLFLRESVKILIRQVNNFFHLKSILSLRFTSLIQHFIFLSEFKWKFNFYPFHQEILIKEGVLGFKGGSGWSWTMTLLPPRTTLSWAGCTNLNLSLAQVCKSFLLHHPTPSERETYFYNFLKSLEGEEDDQLIHYSQSLFMRLPSL